MSRCTLASASRVVIPVLAMLASGAVHPALAQGSERPPGPTQQDQLRSIATAANSQLRDQFRKKSAPGWAAMFTPDATFVELLPQLKVMTGRAEMQRHIEEVLASNATDFIPTVTTANMTRAGTFEAGGDYTLVVGNKIVPGHFLQVFRQEGGAWKIAYFIFARPQPVTQREANTFRGN
ncbi:MAG: DUF4440 domain-containing protein [Acidobacteriaceae bacterium]|nr:DUF4440 domain-containing protein [Acidobacteriaceae bacterium]